MRIQVIETSLKKYEATHVNWFKETCDFWSAKHGIEKLEWLHKDLMDLNCDVFFKPINDTEMQIGFVDDESIAELRWIAVEVLESGFFDALTQLLLVTSRIFILSDFNH